MTIRELFVKAIDRDIKGVIKVGQADEENIRQELEEYVVTRELQKHFRTFFASYKRGILGNTDKMGAWISGFFGSGKSHFLKILSYLLANRIIDGKTALQYFEEDNKIADRMVMADMKLAADAAEHTDVILFNIDSKSEQSGKQDKDAIVSVFLKVFNEMQGFCGTMPYLADLERTLTEKGKYQEFKDAFERLNGTVWEEARYDFGFIQDDIVDVLEEIGFMSHDAALNWCEKAMGDYAISIEGFAALVKKYIERKGHNHHVVFLVDEIGQYIGDDSRLMLNLQTVTEDLGTACGGKAWIVVTSQQDIDAITKTKGNDFSKIQGRFDTRLALSSANVDEVIRKRVLEKTPTAQQTLTLFYDQKETVLKNLLLFNDGIEKKLYANRENFSAVYPFVPYQFQLLGDVLTAIRTHGASGKHLAEGERSMLALFKESAAELKDRPVGTMVPFYLFYNALEKFLDHSHSSVIIRAQDNAFLQPFDVELLKVLFMIKYVKEIRANAENLTTLMVSGMQDDRLALMEKVKESLSRLVRQTLVQRNGDGTYTFLTDEEQEINRAIDNIPVDPAEITQKISEVIFDDLYDEKKYRHPAFNGRYTFPFAQIVDGKPYKSSPNADISLIILTPNSDEIGDDATMRLLSAQSRCVLMVLPEDRTFLDETRSALKIEKFLRGDSLNAVTRYDQIKDAKKIEMRTRQALAKEYLKDALSAATIYLSGSPVQSSAKEAKSRINEALGRLVDNVYHKLSYIDTAMTENDIRKLFAGTGVQQITIDGASPNPNSLALSDMNAYISGNTDKHTKTSMKTLVDRFTKAPYGFVEQDVQWLAAKLFVTGDIAFIINNEPVMLHSRTVDELTKIVTRKEFLEKLMTERKKKVPEKWKKEARELMHDLFGTSPMGEDEDTVMSGFLHGIDRLVNDFEKLEIHFANQKAYPGRQVILSGKKQLTDLRQYRDSYAFLEAIDKQYDTLAELAEDAEPIRKFFDGEQRALFDKALNLMRIYDDSRNFFTEPAVDNAARSIKAILSNPNPFGQIFKLPALIEDFRNSYGALLEAQTQPVLMHIAADRSAVLEAANAKKCDVHAYEDKVLRNRTEYNARIDDMIRRVSGYFDAVRDKAEHCNNVAMLNTIPLESTNLKNKWLTEIANLSDAPVPHEPDQKGGEDKPPVTKHKHVTIPKPAAAQLATAADVDAYLDKVRETLRRQLMSQLEENTILHIDY